MINSKFSPWPCFTKKESNAIKRVLLSNKVNYWTGDECKKFENEFASFVGVKHAIALSNGSVAIEIALKALNIGKGDEVIVTSRTFIASVSSIINVGAKPIFADVNRDTQNINIETIKNLLSIKTKAIICVHLAGWPCEMGPIINFSKKNKLFIIEDCAQAHGAKYKGKSVGSFGHVGAWSFCQDKIITTGGEGGMVTTNHSKIWSKMWSLKDHGKNLKIVNKRSKKFNFTWLHDTFGTNQRMTELQATIGRIQLKHLNKWNLKRINNFNSIMKAASQCSNLRVPKLKCDRCPGNCNKKNGCVHAAYKCYVFVNGNKTFRDKIIKKINASGVPCYAGTCSEVYLEKAFNKTSLRPNKRLPVAKELGETSLMFLCHPTLTKKEIKKTCDVICKTAKLFNK